jgi:hypothetical protein
MGLLSGASGPTGLFGRYRELMGGAADPRLSQQANDTAQRNAMVHAGLTMAAGPGGQGLIPAMARGALAGREHGAAQREQQYMQTQEQRIAQALQDPQLLSQLTPQQQSMIRMMPPMQAMEALQKLLSQDAKVVGEGSALVDPFGRVVHEQAPKAEPLPADLRAILWSMGIDADQLTPEQKAAALKRYEDQQVRRAPRVDINNNPEQRTRNGIIDIALDDFNGVRDLANQAHSTLSSLNSMDRLLEQGLRTGKMTDVAHSLRQFGAAFGMKGLDNVADAEVFRALSNDLTLIQTMKLKGAISEKELNFLSETMPRLGNTPEANRQLIRILREVNQRAIGLQRLGVEYGRRTGVFDMGWFEAKDKWLTEREAEGTLLGGDAAAPTGGPPGRVR